MSNKGGKISKFITRECLEDFCSVARELISSEFILANDCNSICIKVAREKEEDIEIELTNELWQSIMRKEATKANITPLKINKEFRIYEHYDWGKIKLIDEKDI